MHYCNNLSINYDSGIQSMKKRFSAKRQRILETLRESSQALSAADLHSLLPDLNLTTIYRNLEFFTEEKLIKKVPLGAQEAIYEYQAEPHHHAVCDRCQKVLHFKAPDKKIIQLLKLENFEVEELEVIVHGHHIRHTKYVNNS